MTKQRQNSREEQMVLERARHNLLYTDLYTFGRERTSSSRLESTIKTRTFENVQS